MPRCATARDAGCRRLALVFAKCGFEVTGSTSFCEMMLQRNGRPAAAAVRFCSSTTPSVLAKSSSCAIVPQRHAHARRPGVRLRKGAQAQHPPFRRRVRFAKWCLSDTCMRDARKFVLRDVTLPPHPSVCGKARGVGALLLALNMTAMLRQAALVRFAIFDRRCALPYRDYNFDACARGYSSSSALSCFAYARRS
jgi:hypothetical protein